MRHSRKKTFFIHFLYGIILFVISLSTLEQFTQLNDDALKLPNAIFHLIMVSVALAVACYEGYTMKGLEGLKHYLSNPEHMMASPPEGKYKFRKASPEYMGQVYQLARESYGWGYEFSEERLRQWLQINPNCFFMMLFNDLVVGYIDAFPIADDDHRRLVAGKDERNILPQKEENIGEQSSFYIASVVLRPEHGIQILSFLNKALKFYDTSYRIKNWKRVCAIAYTPKGEDWVKTKGMSHLGNSEMWFVDRELLPHLTKRNQVFWSRMLPPVEGGSVGKTTF